VNKLERELLKGARIRIAAGSQKYICIALLATVLHEQRVCKAYIAHLRLRNYIMDRLVGYRSLEQWNLAVRKTHLTSKEAKHARLAWIDWMLETGEGK